jgi:signal transduction histidine kinase
MGTIGYLKYRYFNKEFKREVLQLNSDLSKELAPRDLVYLCNAGFKRSLDLSWVYFYDLNQKQIIFGPEYDSQKNDLKDFLFARSKYDFSGYEIPTFNIDKKRFSGIIPIKIKNFNGLFLFGPRNKQRQISKYEQEEILIVYEHMKTSFARASLYESLTKQVNAQVKSITYQNKRLAELINSRLEFVQTVSHELRTPIMVLSGALELLSNNGISGEERKDLLRLAQQRAKMLSDLVTGILRLARYQKEDSELKINENVDLNEIFINIQEVVRSEVEAKGLRIKIQKNENLRVLGNHNYLEQAFYNLLENAIHSMEEGEIDVYFKIDEKHIVTCIKDAGPGIEADLLDSVFKKHKKGKDSKGLGLGLYLTRAIIDTHHKGHVWFDTGPQGSTFYVRLKRSML